MLSHIEHSEAVELIALGSCRWQKLSWIQKVIRQTHSRKIWINTKTPLLAQEAAELQIVRGQERIAGMCPFMLTLSLCSSLNICYCLATVRARHCTSHLSSMAVMFIVKSPKCGGRETTKNCERWQGLSWLTGGLDMASKFQLRSKWLQWNNPWTPTSFKVPTLC